MYINLARKQIQILIAGCPRAPSTTFTAISPALAYSTHRAAWTSNPSLLLPVVGTLQAFGVQARRGWALRRLVPIIASATNCVPSEGLGRIITGLDDPLVEADASLRIIVRSGASCLVADSVIDAIG